MATSAAVGRMVEREKERQSIQAWRTVGCGKRAIASYPALTTAALATKCTGSEL